MSDRVIRGVFLPSWPQWTLDLHMVGRTVTTRQGLLDLDDHLLNDIGLDRAAALAEARRAPWDVSPPRPRRRDRPESGNSFWTAVRRAFRLRVGLLLRQSLFPRYR